jgi:hypothetical protein
MSKRKPRRPDPDPNVAAYETVSRLTGRDTGDDQEKPVNREAGESRKRGRRKRDGEQTS